MVIAESDHAAFSKNSQAFQLDGETNFSISMALDFREQVIIQLVKFSESPGSE